MTGYRTIEGASKFELVEKKSRFIAHLSHVDTEDAAISFLNDIRHEHAQARHNVYAYLLRGGRARYSDDGEPSQTSGLPTYETISHAGLEDVICVTTRYFGGTLLGTGGLVRAYTQACKGAIESASIVTVSECVEVAIDIPYSLYQTVHKIVESSGAKMKDEEFDDSVHIVARVTSLDCDAICDSLVDATNGRAGIRRGEPFEGVL